MENGFLTLKAEEFVPFQALGALQLEREEEGNMALRKDVFAVVAVFP